MSNAFKFTTEGSVTLGWKYVEDDKDKVEVYVKDTGIGVAPEKQAQLFERYIKVDETDKGTGLGLNISKTIMEKQNVTINPGCHESRDEAGDNLVDAGAGYRSAIRPCI